MISTGFSPGCFNITQHVFRYCLLLILIPVLISLPVQGKHLCYRKYDEKRNACKFLVSDRQSSDNQTQDLQICCSTYGQGYATKIQRIPQLRRKWYECTPCSKIEEDDSSFLSDSEREEQKISTLLETSKHTDSPNLKTSKPQHTDEASERNNANNDLKPDKTGSFQKPKSRYKDGIDKNMKPKNIKDDIGYDDDIITDDDDEDLEENKSVKSDNVTDKDLPGLRWSEWSPCSRTCGPPHGTQWRVRKICKGPGGSEPCHNDQEQRICQPPVHCTVDGGWSNWTMTSCSVTCGEGHVMKSRLCNNPVPAGGGRDCEGEMEEVIPCTNPACSVDGGWSEWSDWTRCPVVCSDGIQTRTRTCTNPPPSDGGKTCRGADEESAPCSSRSNCPVNGNWSEWSRWDICSARPCSGKSGHRIRFRTCTEPRPMFGGRPCRGKTWNREVCYSNEFCTETVNGGWCPWSNWTECSSDIQIRTRDCQCPPPANGGTQCIGTKLEERVCVSSELKEGARRFSRTEKSEVKSAGCPESLGSGAGKSDTQECEEDEDSKLSSSGDDEGE